MPCYHPIRCWTSPNINPETGKRPMVFNRTQALNPDNPKSIPCGRCIGCKLERSRQWAMRCMNEAHMYEHNCFITLTFNPEFLATRKNPQSVDKRDFQLFMKRLRKKYSPKKIRFYHCGEYGEKNGRPHYHALLFNHDFMDKIHFKTTPAGSRIYLSDQLSSLWVDPLSKKSMGYVSIGDVNFKSAAYVARYILKKINGSLADIHYCDIDSQTGEILSEIQPEYTTMSRKPGIGKTFYQKYKTDFYPHDHYTVNGTKQQPPRYYDNQYELENPLEFDQIKKSRLTNQRKNRKDQTLERLQVREQYQNARLRLLARPI